LTDIFTNLATAHPALVVLGIFLVLLLCGFGLPLPEDIVLAFTGYAVHLGVMPIWLAVVVGVAGVLIGDSTLWYLGRRYGENVFKLRLVRRLLPPQRLERVQRLYQRYGSRVLFTARFTPMLRAGVFLFAGWARVSYLRFLATDGSAALISVPTIIIVTYLLGNQIDRAVKAVRGVEHWILVAIGLAVIAHIVHGVIARRREAREATGAAPASQRVDKAAPDEPAP
jgi:membrane protein DedA with SNARE-associated domain